MKALTKKRFELLLCGVLSCLPVFRGQAFSADSIAYHHVLLEDFGGTWCSNCPRVADSIAVLASDFDRLAVAGYQTAETRPDVSFLYNMDVYYRMCYYDTIRTVPALFVNGREAGNIRALRDSLEKAMQQKTVYDLEMELAHFPLREQMSDSFQVRIKASRLAADKERDLRLHVAFLQDRLPFRWYDQTEVNHATAFMLPDGNGLPLALVSGDTVCTYSFSIPYQESRLLVKNAYVVAFLQDATILAYDTVADGRVFPVRDNTVLQALRLDLGTGEYTAGGCQDPSFHNWSPEILTGESVRYYDNTMGDVESYAWEFEGGVPATSQEMNPLVHYPQAGVFPVSLRVVSGGETRVFRQEEVVRVLDVSPRISISPNPVRPGRATTVTLLSEADSCEWHFFGGDPFIAYGKEVQVEFPLEGTYDARVSVFYRSPYTGTLYEKDTVATAVIKVSQDAGVEDESIPKVQLRKDGPCSDCYRVESSVPVEQVSVFSMDGRCMLDGRSGKIDLSSCPSGLYIVSVKVQGTPPTSFKLVCQ